MSEKHIMTNKYPRKEVKCAYPGCEDICVVTIFATPSRCRCPAHKKAKMPSSASVTVAAGVSRPDALQNLNCPGCGAPMRLLSVHAQYGELAFGCRQCNMLVEITADWAHMHAGRFPDEIKEICNTIKEKQSLEYIKYKKQRLESGVRSTWSASDAPNNEPDKNGWDAVG